MNGGYKECRKYKHTPNEVRQMVIEKIIKNGQMINETARELQLNRSTVSTIVKTYKCTGRINRLHRQQKPETINDQKPIINELINEPMINGEKKNDVEYIETAVDVNVDANQKPKFPFVPIVYLTRIEKFSSAHRLFNTSKDDEWNQGTFQKCYNTHGHNYTLETTIKGPVNQDTGMVINIKDFKQILQDNVIDILDHKHLDQDISYFKKKSKPEKKNVITTSENICVWIWQQIQEKLPEGVQLFKIKLFETDKNVAEFYGEFEDRSRDFTASTSQNCTQFQNL